MKAVFTTKDAEVEVRDTDVPVPQKDQVLVKVAAISQNPTDWKTIKLARIEGAIVGSDFAGTIEKLGSGVDQQKYKVGARVAGHLHGGLTMNGAFAEYVVPPAHILVNLPDDWSFEDAAQLGISAFTACQVLWQSLDLPTPFEDNSQQDVTLLVWGGSTASAHYVIQMAKLAGITVITTASSKHHDRLKALGADEIFDHDDAEVSNKIREASHNELKYAVDCISDKTSYQKVANSLREEGGVIACLLPYPPNIRPGVRSIWSLTYDTLAEPYKFPKFYKPRPQDRKFGAWAAETISRALSEGRLKPLELKIYPHGLASVAEGLKYMEDGKVSGVKLTYRIADTPGI